ncbi:MAG: hypothetical protein GY941_30175, partial [Planctomycetes bacterium]|nr:hypothetical protein [Planctomycetota bacterium]
IDCKIYTSLSSQGWLDVYKRAVSYGECVDLGGNRGPGFSGGTVSNYIILESSTNVGDQCDGGGGGDPCDLDSKFVYGVANNGAKYYTDRSYIITDAGPFAGMAMIKTPNADRNSTMSSGYLTEKSDAGGTVYYYVAYDKRASTPPNWLTSTFTKIDCKIKTSLSSQGWLDVYKRAVSYGECVDLGGNRGPGYSGGSVSNYIVLESGTEVGDECDDGGDLCELDSKFTTYYADPPQSLIGKTYYTDRPYTITGYSAPPGFYFPEIMIKTPNDDRNNTQPSDYLTYRSSYDVENFYFAFDSRLTSLPEWAGVLTPVDVYLYTSLSTQPYMKLYHTFVFPDNCLNPGGNKADGASTGTASNYILFIDLTPNW